MNSESNPTSLKSIVFFFIMFAIGSVIGNLVGIAYHDEIDQFIRKCDGIIVELTPISDCLIKVEGNEVLVIHREENFQGLHRVEGSSLHDLIYSEPFAPNWVLFGPAVIEPRNGEDLPWTKLTPSQIESCPSGGLLEIGGQDYWSIGCWELPPPSDLHL